MEVARVVLVMDDSDWTNALPERQRGVDGYDLLGSKNEQSQLMDGMWRSREKKVNDNFQGFYLKQLRNGITVYLRLGTPREEQIQGSIDEFNYGLIELEVPMRLNILIHLFIHSRNIY